MQFRYLPPFWNNYAVIKERYMKVIADLCVVPMGVGVSVSKYVTECEKVLKEAGLETKLHAYGTNIEGDWDVVFAAIRRCHEVVHEMGAPRITTTLKFGTRIDRMQTMKDKVSSVQNQLGTE
jgi:uncharacterized protein (TIGR00106 family)